MVDDLRGAVVPGRLLGRRRIRRGCSGGVFRTLQPQDRQARADVPPAQHNRGLAIAGLVVAGLGLVWNIGVLIAALAPSSP